MARLWQAVDGNEKINDRRAGRLLSWIHESYVDERHATERLMCIFYDTPFEASDLIALLDPNDGWIEYILRNIIWEVFN